LNEAEAIKAQNEIEALLKKHGAQWRVVYDRRPDLRFICFEKISLKVENDS